MFLQSGDLNHLLDAPAPVRGQTRRPEGVPGAPDRKRESPPTGIPAVPQGDVSPDGGDVVAEDALSAYQREIALADAAYIEVLDVMEEIYGRRYSDRERVVASLVAVVTRLIDLTRDSNAMLRKAIRLKRSASSLAEHSLNTAILAIKIGMARGFTRERLFSLGLSAVLGDIGMTAVDAAILTKTDKLSSGEIGEIKRHVQYSKEILESEFPEFPFLPAVAIQIHEREDGSGYPLGLRGENIHEFAKIIGLSDVYIAMTSRKAHREDFSGYSTLQQIISRRGVDFNAAIIKSLIDVISVFPLESLIRLNNGAIGRVIDISRKHPTRPKLSILITSDGERLNIPRYLDLEQEPLLYVETPDIEEGVVL